MAYENLKSIDFPEGSRVKIVAAEFDSPIGRLGPKDAELGVGRTARVHRVSFSDRQGRWSEVGEGDQVVMYTLVDEATNELIVGNFLNPELRAA